MSSASIDPSGSSPKRICSEHSKSSTSNVTKEQDLPAELTARLQTVGSRIRKSVLEGHKTRTAFERQNFNSSSLPGSPRSSSPPPYVRLDIFKTSKDAFQEALRDVRPGTCTLTSSPRKRTFEGGSHRDSDSDLGAETMETDMVPDLESTILSGKHRFDRRPMRPLKRVFGKTQSAPAGALRFSTTTSHSDYEPIDVDAFMDAF